MRPYLLGHRFTIRTDQQSLKYLLERKMGTPTQQRWLSKLLGYDFTVEYRKGRENKVADALSRREKGTVMALSGPQPTWIELVQRECLHNSELQQLQEQFREGKLDPRYTGHAGVIFYKGKICVASNSPL